MSNTACSALLNPPDAVDIPDAPTLDVSPDDPRALDDITVSVTDPQPFVEYEFEWCRFATQVASTCTPITGGIQVGLTFSEAPSDDVGQHFPERFRVTVTPRLTGTDIEGPSRTININIGDTPSHLASIQLNTYRVVEGEVLHAEPETFIDPDNPDGDGIGLTYRWYREDSLSARTLIREEEVSDIATGDELDLSALSPGDQPDPGDTIFVEVTPIDANATIATEVGPSQVIADTTRWIPLLPERQFKVQNSNLVSYDGLNNRLLLLDGSNLWEAYVEAATITTSATTKFVKLYPTGTRNADLGVVGAFFDESLYGGEKMVWMQIEDNGVGGNDGFVFYTLDVSKRGSETWTRIEPTGDLPPPEGAPYLYYDSDSNKLYLISSCLAPSPFIWTIDLSVQGTANWTRAMLEDGNGSATERVIYGGTMIGHPSISNRLLLIGGAPTDLIQDAPLQWHCDIGGGLGTQSIVHRVDIPDSSAPTLQPVIQSGGHQLVSPSLHFTPLLVQHPNDNKILIAAGEAVNPRAVWILNLDSLQFDTSTIDDASPILRAGGAAFNPNNDTFIFWRGRTGLFGPTQTVVNSFAFAELRELSTGSFAWDAFYEHGTNLPPGLAETQVWGSSGSVNVTGGVADDGATISTDMWIYVPGEKTWSLAQRNLAGPIRYGVNIASRADVPSVRYVTRGKSQISLLPPHPYIQDPSGWTLVNFDTSGPEIGTGSLVVPLTGLGCQIMGSPPQENSFIAFGGEILGTYDSRYSLMRCSTLSPTLCTVPAVTDDSTAPARSYTAAAILDDNGDFTGAMFGGQGTGVTALGDLYSFRPCDMPNSVVWNLQSPDPDLTFGLPSARFGQMLTLNGESSGGRPTAILSGGYNPMSGFSTNMDPWILTLEADSSFSWQRVIVDPESELPAGRVHHIAIWDNTDDVNALILYGGQTDLGVRSDMWELRLRD